MVVDERCQQVLEEVVDQRRVVARDVAVAEVVAHHRGVFALHQRVVVAVSWAGFGELLDVQLQDCDSCRYLFVQQFGDLSIDVLSAIVRVEAIDDKRKCCDQAAQGRHHETLGYRLYGGHELVLGDRINDVDLVEALGAVQVALVNRINSQETGLAPGVGLAPLADGHCHWLGFGYRIAAPQVGIGLPQPVQMTMRQAGQSLETAVLKDLVLPLHATSGTSAARPAEGLVQLREQADVGSGVTPPERFTGPAAAVLDLPGLAILPDQSRDLRPR